MVRISTKFITYTITGKLRDIENWAYREGTKIEIEESALNLLLSLKIEYSKARVFIDGKGITRKGLAEKNDSAAT